MYCLLDFFCMETEKVLAIYSEIQRTFDQFGLFFMRAVPARNVVWYIVYRYKLLLEHGGLGNPRLTLHLKECTDYMPSRYICL